MRDWNPPLQPDKWYAHIFRTLLRKNSRKRAGMKTDKVKEVITEEGEEEFHWRYAILEKKHGGETYFHVCEEYPGLGYTDEETPMGETPEELVEVLEMMLKDARDAIECSNIIVSGEPYNDWRSKDIDEDDIGDDPTVPFNTETLDNEED